MIGTLLREIEILILAYSTGFSNICAFVLPTLLLLSGRG